MAKFHGTIVLEDYHSIDQVQQAEFQHILRQWSETHGEPQWCYHVVTPGPATLMVGAKAEHVTVDQNEVYPSGSLWVGPFKAYMGDFQVVLEEEEVPRGLQEAFNFPEALLQFFSEMHFSEEMRQKVLSMTVREFLDTCKTAAEDPDIEVDASGDELELHIKPVWIPRKMEVIAGKVTCPSCSKAKLHVVDGIVTCPICNYTMGDIDELP